MIRFLGSEVRGRRGGRISVQAAGADSFRIVCSLAFLRATLANRFSSRKHGMRDHLLLSRKK